MTTIDLDLLETLGLATALFFVGQLIVNRSAFLQRYSITVPVGAASTPMVPCPATRT